MNIAFAALLAFFLREGLLSFKYAALARVREIRCRALRDAARCAARFVGGDVRLSLARHHRSLRAHPRSMRRQAWRELQTDTVSRTVLSLVCMSSVVY